MGSGGLTRKEIERLVLHIEPQGVKATKVKNGLMLRLPDGESTTVHWTSSDVRAASNLRARLRRSGVSWPTDGKQTKRYKASEETMAKGLAALTHLGVPASVKIPDLVAAHEAIDPDTTWTRLSAQRFLLASGYFQVGMARGARWIRSTEPDTHEPDPEPTAVVPEPEPTPEPEPPKVAAREFIDTADSFTLNMGMLWDLPLSTIARVLNAGGMSVEVRAWQGGLDTPD